MAISFGTKVKISYISTASDKTPAQLIALVDKTNMCVIAAIIFFKLCRHTCRIKYKEVTLSNQLIRQYIVYLVNIHLFPNHIV